MLTGISSFIREQENRRTLGYYSIFISLGMNLAVIGTVLPALADQTSTRLGLMGTLFLVSSIGYVFGTVAGGSLFDKAPGHPILGAAGLCGAAVFASIPLINTFPLLLILFGVKGIADGMLNTGTNTLLLWTHGDKSAPFMTGLHFAFGIGAFISPLIAARIIAVGAPHGAIFILLAAVSAAISLRTLLDRSSPDPSRNNHDQPGSAGPLAHLPILVLSALFLFFYVGAEITFGGWLYSFALALDLASETTAAYLTSGFYLAFTIGRLFAIPAASRFDVEKVIGVALIACLITLGTGTLFFQYAPVLWAMTLGTGFFMAPIFPAGFSLAGKSMTVNARSSSYILLGDSFGGMILPWAAGLIIEATIPQSMLFLVLGSLVLNLIVFSALLQARKRSITIME